MRTQRNAFGIGRKFIDITLGVVLLAAVVSSCADNNKDDGTTVVIKNDNGTQFSTTTHPLIYSGGADINCGSANGGITPCEAVVPGPSYEANAFVQGSYCTDPTNGKCELKTSPTACAQAIVSGKLVLTCPNKICLQDADCDDFSSATSDKCVVIGAYGVCASFGGACDNGALGACSAKGIKHLNPSSKEICSAPAPASAGGEICGDKIDNDCDGQTDEEGAQGCVVYWTDSDNDSFGVAPSQCLCAPAGLVKAIKSGDCADNDAARFPGNVEVCDNKDNDCNGMTDEPFTTKGQACDGADADSCKNGTFTCKADGSGVECVNENPANLVEICDNVDNDCDGQTDEGCDDDKDGYCDKTMALMGLPSVCPKGGNDCDDSKSQISPAAIEKCNGVDDNCDGQTDEGFKLGSACTKGLGECQTAGVTVCAADGSATCNAADVPPGTETCDGKDNDCDGQTDEGCDDDKDGYCDKNMTVIGTPAVCAKGKDDCDDNQSSVYPGAIETCDGLDNNCDGKVDEGLDVPVVCGNGVCKVQVTACVAGKPMACAADMTKQTTEKCDGLDNDCNGQTDEGGVCEPSKAPKKLKCGESVLVDTSKDLNAKNIFGAWQVPTMVGNLPTPGKDEVFDLSGIPTGTKFKFYCSPANTSPAGWFDFAFFLLKGVSAVPDTDTNNDSVNDLGSKAMISGGSVWAPVPGVGGVNVWAAVDLLSSTKELQATCSVSCF